jgi:hypothetical protein
LNFASLEDDKCWPLSSSGTVINIHKEPKAPGETSQQYWISNLVK